MKLTKEVFADKIIEFIHELNFCPDSIGLKELKNCGKSCDCEGCWKRAIEQGVE